jgi:hypothetical protein
MMIEVTNFKSKNKNPFQLNYDTQVMATLHLVLQYSGQTLQLFQLTHTKCTIAFKGLCFLSISASIAKSKQLHSKLNKDNFVKIKNQKHKINIAL